MMYQALLGAFPFTVSEAEVCTFRDRKEMTGVLEGMGNTRMRAGLVLSLSGWGHFDSAYVIQRATHGISRVGRSSRHDA